MYFFHVDIPHALCEIDDELKAIYHKKDTVCIQVFNSRYDRSNFVEETTGMVKEERENQDEKYYNINFIKQLKIFSKFETKCNFFNKI